MRYLSIGDVLEIHARVMRQSGGAIRLHDSGALESSVAQPRMAFGGNELYPSIVEKASSLGYSLIQNHPFTDGNKRTGHAAMEVFLILNGWEIDATVDEQADVIWKVAASTMGREVFTEWLRSHLQSRA